MKLSIYHIIGSGLAACALFACTPDPVLPEKQVELASLVCATFTAYDAASTDAKKEQAIEERHQKETDYLKKNPTFQGYECTVLDVKTSKERSVKDPLTEKAIAMLSAECGGFTLYNMDTALLGMPDNAIIEQTDLYAKVITLDKGDKVTVSGFFSKKGEGMYESSLTDAGMMRRPEYVVTFTDVNKRQ